MGTPISEKPPLGEEPPDPPQDQHLDVLEPQRTISDYTFRRTMSMDSNREVAERSRRLDDQITELQAERMASRISHEQAQQRTELSLQRSRSRRGPVPEDEFDIASRLPNEKASVYRPLEPPSTRLARWMKHVHDSYWIIRYFIYITPISALLVVPIILGAFVYPNALVGGVYLMWFSIWFEIVWLSLWAGRIAAYIVPWPLGVLTSLFSDASKKWRDMAKQLEIPMTLFLWGLGLEVSFLPLMQAHMVPNYTGDTSWLGVVNEIIISIFVGLTLNLVEKIIIQLVAISFHTRTYEDRIETNNTTIGFLIHLYTYSKTKLSQDDSAFEDNPFAGPGSGARTPMAYVQQAEKGFTNVFRKVGDAAGKVAEDFTGRKARKSTQPSQVVLVLLNTEKGCRVLARRIFRTHARKKVREQVGSERGLDHEEELDEEEEQVVYQEDMRQAFDAPGAEPDGVDDVTKEAFTIFDRDMNGDITAQELELAVMEVGSERKSILASLKDLDSVVSKLDEILVWLVVVITGLVLLSLVSKSAAGVLTSAGSTLLALSWLFSTSAQEFLGSLIFVFIKHPFDVGDRISVYGNTGNTLKGDDYYVKTISLLYTEFKKLQGQTVQAPNNYLNTLFILNMRRSGGLSEAIPINVKFGTTLDQIEGLRLALLDSVKQEPREYQPNIITEVKDIVDCWSVTINVCFFYKTNWQNEGLRLRRRNKFLCMLMHYITELGIEGPNSRQPGYGALNPLHVNYSTDVLTVPPRPFVSGGPNPRETESTDVKSETGRGASSAAGASLARFPSIIRHRSSAGSKGLRSRGESMSSLSKRVDFSLGTQDAPTARMMGDIHDETPQTRVSNAIHAGDASAGSHSRFSVIEEGDEGVTLPGSRERRGSSLHGSRGRSESNATSAPRAPSETSERTRSHRDRFFGLRLARPRGDSAAGDEGRMERGSAGMSGPRSNPSSPRATRSRRSGSLWSKNSTQRS